MRSTGRVQQFSWVSADTAKDFIRLLNEAGAAGFELYSTYKVVDRFMGALMVTWVDAGVGAPEGEKEPLQATVLRLVPSPELEHDGELDSGKPAVETDD